MASSTLPARSGPAVSRTSGAASGSAAVADPSPKTPQPDPTKTRTRSEYRPDIDGIRGAAAIMVMGFHANVPGFEGAYIGLDLFFVVSGYVITGLLMYEYQRTGTIKWGAFYARRARRLIPAKATMLIGVLILSYLIATPTGSQQQTAKAAAAAAGFVSNFFFWQQDDIDYFGLEPGTGVLLHTWSLSVEEQFYLALPLAILLALALAKVLRLPTVASLLITSIALGAASLWLAIAWAGSNPDAAYYLPITRAFEFLLGVALALVVRKVRLAEDLREVMGLAGAAIIAFVLWKPMPVDGYPSYWALLPCVAAALLVWAGVGGPTAVTRLLSTRLLVGLGLVSYGWYLWHWPLLVLGESLNLAVPPLWARVGLVMVALGIAYLSYRFIEGLFYKRSGSVTKSKTWGARRVIISGVVAMSTVASLSTGALALANDQADTPRWEAVSQQLNDVPEMPSECLGENAFIPDRPVRCDLVPFDPQRPTVVLWGDSHAWMLIPAIEAAAEGRDVNLVAFVMGACPPLRAPDDIGLACARNNEMAYRFVEKRSGRKKPPVLPVLSASWPTYLSALETTGLDERTDGGVNNAYIEQIAELFRDGTPQLFADLSLLNVDVDVVGPTPFIPRNAPLCEARSRPFSCDVARTDAIVDEAGTVSWLQEMMGDFTENSRYIDIAQSICDDDTCYAESDGVVNFFDDNHISAALSRRLDSYFVPSLRGLVERDESGLPARPRSETAAGSPDDSASAATGDAGDPAADDGPVDTAADTTG
jgi:peptidoglycan/LPS O-acetylase OafA/YrhL